VLRQAPTTVPEARGYEYHGVSISFVTLRYLLQSMCLLSRFIYPTSESIYNGTLIYSDSAFFVPFLCPCGASGHGALGTEDDLSIEDSTYSVHGYCIRS
jgi:hypothetical protein